MPLDGKPTIHDVLYRCGQCDWMLENEERTHPCPNCGFIDPRALFRPPKPLVGEGII